MIARYMRLLNELQSCPKEQMVDVYIQILLTPLEIKNLKPLKCQSRMSYYAEAAKRYLENQSCENREIIHSIIIELENWDEEA